MRLELLSSGTIDLFDKEPIPLNFVIADIREPENRDGSYSKTIKLPASQNNNKLFTRIYDLNVTSQSFNPNKKAEVVLIHENNAQLIRGFLQLKRIIVEDGIVKSYEAHIKGRVSNVFQSIGDTLCRDLDWSDLNHNYTRAVQKSSWSNTTGYVYPMIDYGTQKNDNEYEVEDFLPATYLKEYIDRIFKFAGAKVNSNFFNSSFFRSLIVPSNDRLKYSDVEMEEFQVDAGVSPDQTFTDAGGVGMVASGWKTLAFNNEIKDLGGNYNPATYEWTCPDDGYWDIDSYSWISTTDGPSTIFTGFRLIGVFGGFDKIILFDSKPVGASPTLSHCFGKDIKLNAGDKLRIAFTSNPFTGGTRNYTLTGASGLFIRRSNSNITKGSLVPYNRAIPDKLKARDLLLNVIKQFNLYVDYKEDNNEYLIEPYDDFYSSGTIVDWSMKLDNSKELEIVPMGELDFKKFTYEWKKDTDYWNTKHINDWNIGYGDRELVIDNDFLTSEKKLQSIFSATPLVANSTDRLMPKIYGVNSGGAIEPKASNIRLIFYGGVKTTNNSWKHDGTTETTYPYCGHIDNPANPTFDLNFGSPREVYYDANEYTAANIYNVYHRNFIELITDRDSKIVTGYFYLTPRDIKQLDFRNKFYFEKQLFILNKIYDYDATSRKPVKCEFIKLKDGFRYFKSFYAKVDLIGGSVEAFPNAGDLKPVLSGGTTVGNVVLGKDNVVSTGGNKTFITGDSNYVSAGSDATILGSSGVIVAPNVNAVVINSNDATITENGIYVNGVNIATGMLTGSGTLNRVAKFTPTGTQLGDSQIFDNGTNVGIGTSSPGVKFEVLGNVAAGLGSPVSLYDTVFLATRANTGAPNYYSGMQYGFEVGGGMWGIGMNYAENSYQFLSTGGTTAKFIWGSGTSATPNEKFVMRLSDGYMGVNINNPLATIHCKGSGSTSATNTAIFENSSGAQSLVVRDDGYVIQRANDAAIADAGLSASQMSWYIDESGNNLICKVKYADGTTVKTATIGLT